MQCISVAVVVDVAIVVLTVVIVPVAEIIRQWQKLNNWYFSGLYIGLFRIDNTYQLLWIELWSM